MFSGADAVTAILDAEPDERLIGVVSRFAEDRLGGADSIPPASKSEVSAFPHRLDGIAPKGFAALASALLVSAASQR